MTDQTTIRPRAAGGPDRTVDSLPPAVIRGFDSAELPMWVYDADTLEFLAVNAAAVDRYGYSREEFLSLTVDRIRPESELARLHEFLATVPQEVLRGSVWRHRGKDGREFDVETVGLPLGYDGRRARLVLVLETELRTRAEAALREIEQGYRRLVELSPNVVALVEDGLLTFVNSSGAMLLGSGSAEELAGRRVAEFFVDDEYAAFEARARRAAEGGVPRVEQRIRKADGGEAVLEISIIRFNDAVPRKYLVFARDVTETKRAEEEYRRTVSLLRSTLDSSGDGILVVDQERRVVAFNRRFTELWQLAPESLAGRTDTELMAEIAPQIQDHDAFIRSIEESHARPELESSGLIEFRDGRIVERLTRPQLHDGVVRGRVYSFRDVTDQWRAEAAVRRRDAILQAVSFAAARFLKSSDWRAVIAEVLERIGLAAAVSRVYIFERLAADGEAFAASQTYEWCEAGIEPQIDAPEMQNLPFEGEFAAWADALEQNQIVLGHVRDFSKTLKDVLVPQQIKSLLMVPIFAGGQAWGFIGFDECLQERTWDAVEIDALRTAAETLGSTINRQRAEAALRSSEERYRQLFERNLAGVYRNTLDGKILDCNDACAGIFGYSSREELLSLDAHDFYFEPYERHELIERLARQGTQTNLDLCLRRRDGSSIWVSESAAWTTMPDGTPVIEGTLIDISDRKRTEERLRESEERYRLMAEHSTDMISRFTPDGICMYASPASYTLLGYDPHEIVGHEMYDFMHPEDIGGIRHLTQDFRRREMPITTISYRVRKKDGSYIWFETTSRSLRHPESGEIQEVISVSRDITERKMVEEQIEYQAYHDALTALPNRVLFRDRLTVSLAHARRLGASVAVMFLDLDNFKYVNDTLGHSAGDQLLQEIGRRLQNTLREEDSVARMGGDEFTILLSDLGNDQAAAGIAQKILETVAMPCIVDGHELHVTASIGIALFPNDGDDAETLLKNADNAMYRAKELGRNNYQLCSPLLNVRALERLSIENAIRRGLRNGEFTVYFQPLIDSLTGRVTATEALVRWAHPERGVLLPAEFIPIAEESRLIFPLGEYVLRAACAQTKQWHERGRSDLRVAVNLSARQFQHRDIVRIIDQILRDTGLGAEFLELEITESTAMQNTEWTIAVLNTLKAKGIRISIDDFGTGHSSLHYVKRFPIDRIKIDRSFVQDHERPEDAAIIRAVITMARGLRIGVTAEGVETEAQRVFLESESCTEMQGYLFGRPLPAGQLATVLQLDPSVSS
jgi:diguanylate cyclase (GGDEF)-like protein/PAS domain S-box-containing protein